VREMNRIYVLDSVIGILNLTPDKLSVIFLLLETIQLSLHFFLIPLARSLQTRDVGKSSANLRKVRLSTGSYLKHVTI
jgi:hypothetical protein